MSQQVFKENLKFAQDQDFEIIIRKIRQIMYIEISTTEYKQILTTFFLFS